MRHVIYFLFVLSLIAYATPMSSQDIYKELLQLNKDAPLEEVIAKVNKYKSEFTTQEKWDSLGELFVTFASIYDKNFGTDKGLESIVEGEEYLKEYIPETSEPYCNVLLYKSRLLNYKNRLAESEALTKNLISITSENGYDKIHARSVVEHANSFLRQEKNKKATEIALDALNLEAIKKDSMFLAINYRVLASAYSNLQQIDKAKQYIFSGLELNKQLYGDISERVAFNYHNIAQIYRSESDFLNAHKYALMALNVRRQVASKTGRYHLVGNQYHNLGLSYLDLGEYDLAEEYFALGLKLANEDYYSFRVFVSYIGLTVAELNRSNYKKAKEYNDHVIKIITQLRKKYSLAHLHAISHRIEILKGTEEYDEAYSLGKLFIEKMKMHEEEDKSETIIVYGYLSELALLNNDTLSSVQYLDEFERKTKEFYVPGHSRTQMMLHKKLELIYKIHGVGDKLNNVLFEILSIGKGEKINTKFTNVVPNRIMYRIIETWSEIQKENLENGIITIDEYKNYVLDIESYLENHLITIRSNSRLSKEGQNLKSLYLPLITDAANRNSTELLIYIEKVKSLITRVLLQNQMIERKNDDLEIIDALKENLKITQDTFDLEVYGQIVDQMENFHTYKDSLYQTDKGAYIKRFGVNNWDLKDLNKIIDPDEALIEYMQIDSSLFLAVFSRDEHEIFKIDFNKVDTLLSKYLKSKDQSKAKELYDLILPGKIKDKYQKWLVLPDHKLNFINFEELVNHEGKYLLMDKTIRYGYSASILQYQKLLSETNNPNSGILSLTPGFADELKEIYKDDVDSTWQFFLQQPFLINLANNISELKSSVSLTDRDATENHFKEMSSDYKILHFGTHGLLDHESPLFSRLVLAKDTIEDGYLNVYEIYGQNLNAELAVLSACNSGQGKLESSDGIVSLTQAFTHAGSPSVLMTLWEVDEKSTSEILAIFYENLVKGQKKSIALRNAKREFLSNSSYQLNDPYYWAGLVVIGNDDPIFTQGNLSLSWLIWISIGLIVIFLSLFLIRKAT